MCRGHGTEGATQLAPTPICGADVGSRVEVLYQSNPPGYIYGQFDKKAHLPAGLRTARRMSGAETRMRGPTESSGAGTGGQRHQEAPGIWRLAPSTVGVLWLAWLGDSMTTSDASTAFTRTSEPRSSMYAAYVCVLACVVGV
jgi:hypothetical protein